MEPASLVARLIFVGRFVDTDHPTPVNWKVGRIEASQHTTAAESRWK